MISTIIDLCREDDRHVAIWLHGRPEHTQRAYGADIARFRGGAGKPLAGVTLGDVQRFADSLAELAPASRYRALSAVKSLLAFGHRTGYLPFNAGSLLRLPAVRNALAERILTEAEVHRMLALETDGRNRAILTLLYASGVRVSELCGLRWRDLRPNGEGGQITVMGKGGATRSIQVPRVVWELVCPLRGEAAGEEGVFGLKALAVRRIVKKAGARAGIAKVSPHWLRHAHASHALDRGAPIHLVQATLGHVSINTTGRYLHARPKDSSGRFLAL